jgi:N-acetyl-1-D-myo-inositol-2-amino-2-deoxy-alpha-D-glucopyranoside deacetylase
VLAVHAHPDDETLASGALLATWAAAGLPVTVVTCTRGERGEVIGAALASLEGDGPALARHRETEVAAATTALGVRDHRFLDTLPPASAPAPAAAAPAPALRAAERAADAASRAPEATSAALSAGRDGVRGGGAARYEDSGMAWVGTGRAGVAEDVPPGAFVAVPLDEAAGRLALLLRERRPDLVVTYEPGGGYGHPDHVRAHEVTMRAVELAADASWTPAVAWAVAPADALSAGYAALAEDQDAAAVLAAHADDRRATRQSPLELPDPAGPLPSVAAPGPVDLVVDVRPVRDRVLAALRAHATQVQAVRELGHPDAVACYALSNLVLAPVLPAETYRWAPGRAPDSDLRLPPGARRHA